MSIRVVVADDHPLVLDALEALLTLEEDIEVVARCRDGAEAVKAVERYGPDVLILDLRMPGTDGLSTLRSLHMSESQTRVIVFAGAVGDRELVECLRLGVRGVVLKEMAPSMLVQCVRKVHEGDVWVEKRSVTQAVDLLLRREAGSREMAEKLTPREIEVVRLVVSGLRNKEIARRLTVTEGTVKVHLHNVYAKVGVNSRLALLKYAQERGLS
jgi:two-component system nitrate/nitrite response regulator NarL